LEGRVTASRQDVPARFAVACGGYAAALEHGPLDASTRQSYLSRVRSFLSWLDSAGTAGPDPLGDHRGRDLAVRSYRDYLKDGRNLTVLTVNAHLTALAHFYAWLDLGPAWVPRDQPAYLPAGALDAGQQERWLAAVERRPLARDRAIARLLFHAGLRDSELVALNVDDVPLSSRRARVIVRAGQGGSREIPLADRAARADIAEWKAKRKADPGEAALFLNRHGGRMSVRSVRQLLADLAADAGLTGEDGRPDAPPHRIRLTFAANVLRSGTDAATAAALMGQQYLAPAQAAAASPPPRQRSRDGAARPSRAAAAGSITRGAHRASRAGSGQAPSGTDPGQ